MEYTEPVRPGNMALLFVYYCPHCQSEAVLVSPTQPMTITCGTCRNSFPIVPVDQRTVEYVHTMLADGKAAADPNF